MMQQYNKERILGYATPQGIEKRQMVPYNQYRTVFNDIADE